jgi:hypothetical protein
MLARKLDLEVYAEKTKYIFMYCYQKAGQNHNIKVGNKLFEDVAKFKISGNNGNKM